MSTEELPTTPKDQSSFQDEIKALPKDPEKTSTEWVVFIQNLVDKLTYTKILLTVTAAVMFIFVVLLYENREAIFEASVTSFSKDETAEVKWTPSAETKTELTALVASSSLIKSVSITNINLQKNTQLINWFYLDDNTETSVRAKVNNLLAQPVFDYDAKNTQQMVSVLNNEFSCTPFSDTTAARLFPELNGKITTVCRIAIPPFYGRFAGILSFGLEAIPTKNELDSLRLEASKIAVDIYARDVTKKH